MRLSAIATAVSLALIGLSAAEDVRAVVRKPVDIPAQQLELALQALANDRGFQVIYRTEIVGPRRSHQVSGNLTSSEALERLLDDTGLTYRYLDDHTVTIVPISSGKASEAPSSAPAESSRTSSDEHDSASGKQSEARRPVSFWDRFRIAQAAQGAAAITPNLPAADNEPARLEEIVVTAQKREERLQDVPQSVSVIAAKELVATGATQFRDFANTIPGLSFSTAGAGYTQISLRGVTAGVDIGQTVGIYVDEVPFGSSAAFGGSSQHTLDVGLFGVERIEVLRGPQGTLYGASTMGGLIKYVTPLPSTTAFGIDAQAGLSGTRHGGASYSASAALNAPLVTDKAGLRVTGFYCRDGGFIDNVALGDDDANSADIYGGRLDLLMTPTDALSVRLTAYQQEIDRNGEGTVDYTFSGAAPNGELGQRRVFHEPFDQRFRIVSGTVQYDFAGAQLTSISSYQTTDLTYLQDVSPLYVPILGSFGLNYGGVGAGTVASVDKFTQEVRVTSRGARTLEWLFGVYYTDESSDFLSEFALLDVAGAPTPNDLFTLAIPSRFEEYAAFGDLTWHLNDRFDVTGGIRYAHNEQKFEQLGSGLLGLSAPPQEADEEVATWLANARYRFSDHATGYVRIATGYRPGGPNIVAVNPETGLSLAPLTFDADRLTSYEIGYKASTANRRFSAEIATYVVDWNDIHVSVANGGFSAIGNARGGAKVRGAELTLLARPVDALTLSGAFAVQDAEMSQDEPALGAAKGEDLPNVPRFTGALSADYQFSDSGLRPTLGATMRYVDERMASFDAAPLYRQYRLPDYTTVDLRAGFTAGSLNVLLYARNLFDERGLLSAFNWRGTAMPAILQPRTVGISLTTHF